MQRAPQEELVVVKIDGAVPTYLNELMTMLLAYKRVFETRSFLDVFIMTILFW